MRRGSRFGLGSIKLALQIISGGSQQAVDIHPHVWAGSGCCCRRCCRCRCRSRSVSLGRRGGGLRRARGRTACHSSQKAVEIIVGKGRALRSGRNGRCRRRFRLCRCEVGSIEQVINIAGVSCGRGGIHRCQQFVQIRDTLLRLSRRLRRGRCGVKIVQQGVHGIVSGLTCGLTCAGRCGHFRFPFRWLRGDIKGVQQIVHIAHARHEQLFIGVNGMNGLR